MKQRVVSYRITRIAKTTVAVAICGLFSGLPTVVKAEPFNLNTCSTVSISSGAGVSFDVFYTDGDDVSEAYSGGNITLTLGSGADLAGQNITGATGWFAVFTRDVRSGNSTSSSAAYIDTVSFTSTNSTLRLGGGGNQITGQVGVKPVRANSLELSDTYNGGVIADPLDLIEVFGTGAVAFSDQVYADAIEITGGAAQMSFNGNVGNASYPTVLDLNGHDSTITLGGGVTFYGSIVNTVNAGGDRTNGVLITSGAATVTGSIGNSTSGFRLIQVEGSNLSVTLGANSSTSVTTNQLNYAAASNVTVNGDLFMTPDVVPSATVGVTFNDKDGQLNIAGNLTGRGNEPVVSSTANNIGTVTFFGSTQTVTGGLGSLSGNSLKRVNVGPDGNVSSGTTSVTVNGDINATTIDLNQNASVGSSALTVASGYSLTGTVTTEDNGYGVLTMAGGVQTVTGTVGASGASLADVRSGATGANTTFTAAIFSTNISNIGSGTSNFQGNVTATNLNVDAGTSNFLGYADAVTAFIGDGTANFLNTSAASTLTANTDISFTGNGTGNLYNGLTGAINYGGNVNATINLWDNKAISGAITTSSPNTGILNARGNATISSTVGTSGNSIKDFNVSSASAGGVVDALGNVFAQTTNLINDGTLRLANGVNITSTIATTNDSTGALVANGTSTITGSVGSSTAFLENINAGANNSTVTFNSGVVYADKLQYTGAGTVIFNGLSPVDSSFASSSFSNHTDLGFIGTVDFGNSGQGQLHIGDKVDLITQNAGALGSVTNQTIFANASAATLRFLGSSVVTGNLGSVTGATTGENFKDIYAGANGETVTFRGKVFVSDTSMHVSGNGTVNFLDDLSGTLTFDTNGTTNFADGKGISGVVTAAVPNNGTLNFVGSTTTSGNIGSNTSGLLAVNFHHVSSDNTVLPVNNAALATVGIGHNIYALDTTVGTNTTATITQNVNLGTDLTLAGGTVTLYTAGNTTTTPSRFANGTILWATPTRSTISDGGVITTNNATLHFAIGTQAWNTSLGGGEISTNGSSSISGGTGTSLVLSGGETVNVSLLGSLRNGQTHTLINVAGGVSPGDSNATPFTTIDNSRVINTTISRANGGSGDLVATFTRANDAYISFSNTSGHFSNPAAVRLGTLAAGGVNYTADMQTALNMLDIDQWGFGNTEANLARQAKRLAPIANNSNGFAAFKTASALTDSLGLRMHELRIPERGTLPTAVWLKTSIQSGKHEAIGDYDGFETDINLLTLGADKRLTESSLVGVAGSYSTTKVDQRDFRNGEDASIDAYHLSLYGAVDLTKELFLDGTISGSWLETSGYRATIVGRTAQYNIDGDQVTGKLSLGYRIPLTGFNATLTPILSYEASSLKQDAYRETGAGDVGLSVNSETLTRNQAAFGLRFASTHLVGGMVVKPDLAVYATKDSGNFAKPIIARYLGDNSASPSFTTEVARKSAYDLSGTRATLGLSVLMSKYSSLNLRYEHQKTEEYKSNAVDVLVRWDFY